MAKKRRPITVKKALKLKALDKPRESLLTVKELPETNEFEVHKKATDKSPALTARIPKDAKERFQMMPDEFAHAQNAIEAVKAEKRQVAVYGDSLECYIGYDSLLRVMTKYYNHQLAFYRSEAGGSLSPEEARKAVYRRGLSDDEAIKLFEELMRSPTYSIDFYHLMELHDNCPAMAENLWEMIKRDAAREFETGHRAAAAFEPADYMTDAWNRASFIGLRDSLCEEWQPKGGIELTMIDAITQAWLMLQHWTEQSVKRSKTRPREENQQFYEWKRWNKAANPKQWSDGFWDIPMVSEQEAIEHAAQMADRWQRMYFRAIRNLRDWRRYTPQVTINNPQQVNIAGNGGQQINVSKPDEEKIKKIIS